MKNRHVLALCLALLLTGVAQSGEPVFDSHVHLREGEASLKKFEGEVRASGIDLAGLGAMWFGGPHQALRNVGIEHVMLGSDYPQMPLARMVEALEKLDLTQEEKTAILSGNARRILGFKPLVR
jgi:hypothetical protein